MARLVLRRRRLAFAIFPALLVLAGGAGAVAWLGTSSGKPEEKAESAMAAGDESEALSVRVKVRFGTPGKPPVDKTVAVASGANVLDALRAAGVRVTTSEEALAESCCGVGMVHALDGVAADAKTRSGWMYAVNGVPPSVGPAATRLAKGDVVEWTYR